MHATHFALMHSVLHMYISYQLKYIWDILCVHRLIETFCAKRKRRNNIPSFASLWCNKGFMGHTFLFFWCSLGPS